jgi:hypothetical protein
MYKERTFGEVRDHVAFGQRARKDIADNLLVSSSTEECTERLVLEILFDIRDLLKNR